MEETRNPPADDRHRAGPPAGDGWPFERDHPDVVILGPRPGVTPSSRAPVRIFLGTEEAQYRAERVFFWSIEQVRDPARTYEIHLMKNIAGFDRRGWRTGFTKYRFAIPDFAGRVGRAIYNDVDQIYLADPALLFDLDMGEHGYLAISPEETSVMLIDCARMAPLWNRDTANREGKHALIKKPAATPGLWGPCDPHWNARDNEYVEGRTKCLHYTALHQQPWHPFPGDYSYHPNPLAYIWHDLERAADAAGYQVFTAVAPSPDFVRRVATNRPAETTAVLPAALRRLLDDAGASVLAITCSERPAMPATVVDLRQGPAAWPAERFAAVILDRVLAQVPPADLGWLLDESFARAERLVLARVPAFASEGLGSASWWRQRIAEAAARRPGVSWHLEVVAQGTAAGISVTTRRVADPGTPRVWALLDGDLAHDAQVLSLAGALGWPFEEKHLALHPRGLLPRIAGRGALDRLDRTRSSALAPPWPDLVISSGAASVPIARWLRDQAPGQVRLVQLGRPDAPFDLFDLIVTMPHERLPIRPNVLHVAAPLLAPTVTGTALADARDLPRPWTALLVPSDAGPYVLTARAGDALGRAAREEARRRGGSLLVSIGDGVDRAGAAALRRALGTDGWHELDGATMASLERRRDVLAAADAVVLSAGDPQLLAEACLIGKPVALFEPPKWYDSLLVVRPTLRFLELAAGGGKSYRGTPLQQHALSRLLDRLIERGWIRRPIDLGLLHDALVARGLITVVGRPSDVARPRPLDDMRMAVERIRRLMTEAPRAI
jgi:mitochondrial fission protein ELM1